MMSYLNMFDLAYLKQCGVGGKTPVRVSCVSLDVFVLNLFIMVFCN